VTPAAPNHTVLVVEDDRAVSDAVLRGLRLNGLAATAVGDAESALVEVARRRPSVLVVDVGLPGMSGVELCRRLRELGVRTPVLILSARDQVGDRVAGLQSGADDYLVKPFALDELVARLQALLRRSGGGEKPHQPAMTVAVDALWIDADRHFASYDGRRLDLSRREFDLLWTLANNSGIVLSRARLLELVWGYDFDVETNVVDVFVGYVRKKLAAIGAPAMIETVRGVGFVLRGA